MTRIIAYIGAAFILAPMAMIIASSFSDLSYISFPPHGFTLRWYVIALEHKEFIQSFGLSAGLAGIVMFFSVLLSILICLSFRQLPGMVRASALAVIMSPMVLPGIVLGISFLQYFSMIGAGVSITTLVLGHVIITVPYVVRLIYDSLRWLPKNLEWAAASLGASPSATAWKIILPCIKPGIVGGAVFAFIISFGNITISIFLASPEIMTLPVRIFGYTEQGVETWLVAICSTTVVFTVAILWLTERIVGVQRVFYSGKV